jgi:RimJ/RimL family protein N-acetyltransferase
MPQTWPMSLETARLSLRRIRLDDAQRLFELDGDPEVMRYLSGGSPTPFDLIRDEILPRFISYSDRAPWAGVWVVLARESGEFLGWVSLRPGPHLADGGDLGARFIRSAWGKGLATEAASALIERAFSELGMPRTFGTTYEFNLGSRRLMEKLGMRLVRSYRLSGEPPGDQTFDAAGGDQWDGDEVEYALEREEWERLRQV